MNSEEKDILRGETAGNTPLSPLSPADDEVQNILDRLCASFAEEGVAAVSDEKSFTESDGEALSEELQLLREVVRGVEGSLARVPEGQASEESNDSEDAAFAEEEGSAAVEQPGEEEETVNAQDDVSVSSALPPVTEKTEEATPFDAKDGVPFTQEDGDAVDVSLPDTEAEDTENAPSAFLPSFDEEDELLEADGEGELPSFAASPEGPTVSGALAEEDGGETEPKALSEDAAAEPPRSVVPPSNTTEEDGEAKLPKVPEQAYRYYEPSPIDTAEVEDRLASFRHGYQKYMYMGVFEEETEASSEAAEAETKADEPILPLFTEAPAPSATFADADTASAVQNEIPSAPSVDTFEESEPSTDPTDAVGTATMFSPTLDDTVVSLPIEEETVSEDGEAFSGENGDTVVSDATDAASIEKVYPDHSGFMEEVFGTVSASDLDAERERLLDDTVIPEEIASPEPFNADDYVISDRSIGEGMVSGESTREYLSYNQNEDVLQGYRTRIRFCMVKLILVSFLTALLFVTENAFLFGWTIPAFGDGLGVRGLPILLNLQLLLFVVALSLPTLSRGIRILKSKKFCTETNAAALAMIAVVYDIVLYLTDMPSPRMFSFCAALYLTFCHIFEIVKTNGDFMTFQVVSSAAKKTVAVTAALGNFPDESTALSDFSLSDEAPLSEMRRAGFVEGFFSRTTERGGDDIHIVTALLSLIFALAAFALSFFVNTTASIVEHFYVFALSFTATVPVAATFTRRIPFGEAVKKAVLADAAIVGEASAAEFASTEVFALDDLVAFPSRNVKVKGFKLFGDNRLDRVICRVTALFAKLGGPLSGVFGSAGNGGPTVDDVAVLDVTSNGITARLDGDSFLVGNGEFMEQHHVTLYYDSEDARQIESGKISIMYVAENGVIAARFYLQYIPNPAFEKTVERLAEENISVILRTFDPNVTDSLIKRVSYIGERQVRVVHRDASALDEDKKPRLNSGIVTTGAPGTLLPVLYRSIKLGRVFRYGRVINLLSAALSVTVSAVLLALGQFSLLSSAFVGIYQAFWLIPTLLVTKFCLKE